MRLFKEYLEKECGIADTRVYDLASSINSLHSAICLLDTDNADIVRKHGIVNLIKCFSSIEKLRDITNIISE